MNRPRPGAPRRPVSAASKPTGRNALPRSMQIASVIGVLVVCSLVATTLGTIWMDSQGPAPDTVPLSTIEPAIDAASEYETLLRANLEANPDDAASALSLANLLATRREYSEAIPLYAKAVEIEPENPRYRMDFALALAEAGLSADAELQYLTVLKSNPGDAEALFFLGELYSRWNPIRLDEAVASYERAITAEPQSVSASMAQEALSRLKGQLGDVTPVATPAEE